MEVSQFRRADQMLFWVLLNLDRIANIQGNSTAIMPACTDSCYWKELPARVPSWLTHLLQIFISSNILFFNEGFATSFQGRDFSGSGSPDSNRDD